MGTNRIVATGAAVAALVLAGTGCSDSQSDAVKAVCDAQDEVSSAVANLKSFDPTTDSTDDLQSDIDSLQGAVSDLDSARSDLASEYVDSVDSAWSDLQGQIQSLSGDPVSEAAPEAAQDIESAVAAFEQGWADAVQDADC